MTSRGIYHRDGELFGYLVGSAVFDLNDTQTGYLRDGIIYSAHGQEQWILRGDGLYAMNGEAIGYLGEHFSETRFG